MCDDNNQLHLECSVVAKYCKLKTKKKPYTICFLLQNTQSIHYHVHYLPYPIMP